MSDNCAKWLKTICIKKKNKWNFQNLLFPNHDVMHQHQNKYTTTRFYILHLQCYDYIR